MSINIDGRDCCQTGQPSQDVTDGALTIKFYLQN
ncbi:general secretion pathway protein GspL [Escherichia coli]|nr:general secretion pathway protein GspL [Escherichia coli]